MAGFAALRRLRWRVGAGPWRPLCAASGLVKAGARLWVVADDLNHLVELPSGRGRRLFPGELPRDAARRKKVKKDLEALIALPGRRLLAFPSGSKPRRVRGAVVSLDARGRWKGAREIDCAPLLAALDEVIPGLNIEGGFVAGEDLVLLQRGNGRRRFNALVRCELAAFLAWLDGRRGPPRVRVRRARLGEWDGTPLSFTDGFFHDGAVYFSAAAEVTDDPVRDGEVMGSVIGLLAPRGGVRVLARLPKVKVEGLALDAALARELRVLAVTDADDPRRPSVLLRGRVSRA
ncbi:MAG: hypothetical protein SF051_03685 [Elusimicrobiota bacterium]|nr:hypothetical protein [Elusimicrobiota bacterium]